MQQSDREALLDDELILPEQFFARTAGARAPKRPEVKLWIAVMEGAWKTRNREWFASPREDVGSFRWILLMLGLDADAMQPRALRSLDAAKSTRCKRVQAGAGRHRVVVAPRLDSASAVR
jgi:hypothetical protein